MAYSDPGVRERISEMRTDDMTLDSDERVFWRKLFMSGILKLALSKHFWVIDALDECNEPSSLINGMLSKVDPSIPLRVLVLSRETPELKKEFSNLEVHQCCSHAILPSDTEFDMESLVDVQTSSLFVGHDGRRAALMARILEKSNGSFLWTALVLKELLDCHDADEIDRVFEDVPQGMIPLYQRSLNVMSQPSRSRNLVQAILTWVTCTIHPLSTAELKRALELDISVKLLTVDDSVVALCGQLVTIDQFDRVQAVHQTAREFLLEQTVDPGLSVNRNGAHTRIAKACLLYLTGEEMRPPRAGRPSRAVRTGAQRAEFAAYACAAFSYHLSRADARSNEALTLLVDFLRCNIVSWIHWVAETRNLAPLVRFAKHLRTYSNACGSVRSPLSSSTRLIKGWSTDLLRLAAKFADALIASPSAIYSLILPFCPTESAVFNTVRPGRKLELLGMTNVQWDDRLACIDFHGTRVTAASHGNETFAVGLNTGRVTLYNSTTCQEYRVLDHGENVRLLQFAETRVLMVSSGIKATRVWNIHTGDLAHCFESPRRLMALTFDRDMLIAATDKNYIATWDLTDGSRQADRPWNDGSCHNDTQTLCVPSAISISLGHRMLAAAYTGRPIILWELEEDAYYGSCGARLPNGSTKTHPVTALVFNPNPSITILAVSYLDGELVLLDPLEDKILENSRENCHTLASSPDGRLLAGAAGFGLIQIYEFDTLKLLYRVQSSNLYITQLAFSRDGLRFLDTRGSQCNVWEPAVMIRDLMRDGSSESTSSSLIEGVSTATTVKVSATAVLPEEGAVFCGKNDGSVSLYDIRTASYIRTLYSHKASVQAIDLWDEEQIIISVDASNSILVWKLDKTSAGFETKGMHFQSRLDTGRAIVQILCGPEKKLLLSTSHSDHLWDLNGQEKQSRITDDKPEYRKWIQHPLAGSQLLCFEGTVARVHSWDDLAELACYSIITGRWQLKSVIPGAGNGGKYILLGFERDSSPNVCGFSLVDTNNLTARPCDSNSKNDDSHGPIQVSAPVDPSLTVLQSATLVQRAAHLISVVDNLLYFIDTASWVCSMSLNSFRSQPTSYTRHFFLPYDWLAGKKDAQCAVFQRDFLIARNDGVALIKNGLEFAEEVHLDQ